MSAQWSNPKVSEEGKSPYVDWWSRFRDDAVENLFNVRSFGGGQNAGRGAGDLASSDTRIRRPMAMTQQEIANGIIEKLYQNEAIVPKHADNEKPVETWDTGQITQHLPGDLPIDTVLTAVIDTGIPLGHRRTRRRDGSTRIIAAWQQTATFSGQTYLNFGEELYSQQINDAIQAHSQGGSLLCRLDEEAFNRATKLVEPHLQVGHRDLEKPASHGSHVLDLTSGYDPATTPEAVLDRNRIIAVNLPPQALHGTAGNFLALWAIHAIERILHVAKAVWVKNRDKGNTVPEAGYPLVINFSYGMQAGPKNGESHLEKAIETALKDHRHVYRAPVRLVMPVGNDNLDQMNARAYIGTIGTWDDLIIRDKMELPWRFMPEDHTPNFVELWTAAMPGKGKADEGGVVEPDPKDFTLSIAPPGMPFQDVPALGAGEETELGDFAKIYCRSGYDQASFVVAVAPTATHSQDMPLAPAGLWRLRVQCHAPIVNANLQIQSDQAFQMGSLIGRRSYFDHEKATKYHENGQLRDSYDYETGAHTDAWHVHGPVQIKGTQNALATKNGINLVGGHRVSDGKPAAYSSTSDGDRKRNGQGREFLDATYPSEDAPSLFGILAAGARDGSVVAYRGTSMAAGLATRDIAIAFSTWSPEHPDAGLGDNEWLRARAKAYQSAADRPEHYRKPHALKGGMGQIPEPAPRQSARALRLGLEDS